MYLHRFVIFVFLFTYISTASGLSVSCYAASSNHFIPRALLLVTEAIHGSLLIVEGFLLQLALLQDKWIQWILSAPLQGLCLMMILNSVLRPCNTQLCQNMTKHQHISRNLDKL
jgi:hypothetical protein